MNLAPIGIITYSRINHLRKTIDSLKANDLAKESELYIFLDGPKKGDEEKVNIVREYIYTVNGFKKVHIIERKTNNLMQNAILAHKQLFDEHGKQIYMEDDNIVSSSFLQFMNDGLNFYKDNKSVFAISGFNIPTQYPDHYKYDYYVSHYFNGWGLASWADRGYLDLINSTNQYNEMMADKDLYKKVKKTDAGLIPGLKLIQEGKLDAGDYKIGFHLIKNNLSTIRPIKSLVNNIGNDGSGVHCEVSNKYHNKILNNKKITFTEDVEYVKEIDNIWRKFADSKPSLIKRIRNKIKNYISIKL